MSINHQQDLPFEASKDETSFGWRWGFRGICFGFRESRILCSRDAPERYAIGSAENWWCGVFVFLSQMMQRLKNIAQHLFFGSEVRIWHSLFTD